MLIYHPAFDAYHCIFRMLFIADALANLEFAKLRILDFYLCFPAEIASVQLPQEHIEYKKIARAAKNIYRGPVSGFRTFRDMEAIQIVACRMLAISGLIDTERLEHGNIVRTPSELPPTLSDASRGIWRENSELVKYIIYKMSQIPLTGDGGLKQRTGLMEYRYDAA